MNSRILRVFKAGSIATAAAAAILMPGVTSAQAATAPVSVSPHCGVDSTQGTPATADVYQDLEGFAVHPTCFND